MVNMYVRTHRGGNDGEHVELDTQRNDGELDTQRNDGEHVRSDTQRNDGEQVELDTQRRERW